MPDLANDIDWRVASLATPLREFTAMAGPLPLPPELEYRVRNHIGQWFGRTLVIDTTWSSGGMVVRPATGADPSLVLFTRLPAVVRWLGGRISTLELLAAGEPFRLTGEWTEMLCAHGVIQITMQEHRHELSISDELIEWADRVAEVAPEVPLDEALELFPCPR